MLFIILFLFVSGIRIHTILGIHFSICFSFIAHYGCFLVGELKGYFFSLVCEFLKC